MVATRGQTFKRPWRRYVLSSKRKASSAPIGRKDSWCFHAVGSSNAPLLGSSAAEGLPRIGRTSIATRWRSCGLPQSASCSENFVIPPDVFGQTLRADHLRNGVHPEGRVSTELDLAEIGRHRRVRRCQGNAAVFARKYLNGTLCNTNDEADNDANGRSPSCYQGYSA